LAGDIVNELEAVVRGVCLERRSRGPDEGAAVGDTDDDGAEGNDVGRGAAEQDEGHAVGRGWLPGDGEGLAGGDNLVQRTGDGVARWVTLGGSLASDEAGEKGNNGGLGEHVDGIWYYVINA
jgi:hypothetical protein